MQQTEDREAFVRMVFQAFEVQEKARGKDVLLKPNIVSHEPYPTTAHSTTLETCLRLLLGVVKTVIIADGPACDAGDSKSIIDGHPLKESCEKFGVPLIDLLANGAKKVKARSYELSVFLYTCSCHAASFR